MVVVGGGAPHLDAVAMQQRREVPHYARHRHCRATRSGERSRSARPLRRRCAGSRRTCAATPSRFRAAVSAVVIAAVKCSTIPSMYVRTLPSSRRQTEAPRGRLLERHPHRPLRHRPRHTVARVEGVEDLTIEVRKSPLVERVCDRATDGLHGRGLRRRRVCVVRRGVWREVVRTLSAHLVEIDDHVRHPLEQRRNPSATLRLRLREPVTIQVEEVVIAPPSRPWLIVLGRQGEGIRHRGSCAARPLRHAGPAIRILERIDQHDRVLEDRVHARIVARRQQVVRLEQRRAARRDLVAMHAVQQRHDNRCPGDEVVDVRTRKAPRICQAAEVLLDAVERRDAGRCGNGEQLQGPPFPRPAVLDQSRASGGRQRQCPDIGRHLFRRGHLLAMVVPDDLLQRRKRWIVLKASDRTATVLCRADTWREGDDDRQRACDRAPRPRS